ncbi:hypothetical protein GCM10028783_41590 [Modestobacter muralis]
MPDPAQLAWLRLSWGGAVWPEGGRSQIQLIARPGSRLALVSYSGAAEPPTLVRVTTATDP